ncbi:mannosidase [Capsaspora owczarzaki ATCC 30864]|uniref:alpha-1,2-Mannosidase n=1 Tax=Capsaspora owczarzaki (strain ATCC 30864) TaxID=595528 RepID=A0A0D2VTF4_CAPO3|nr:mannosidase [Capsaspora owczarzaki ATCC 30864]KJE94527.1 mannosidase [Capsaspora owczarzaki ATCC 30864]|eukprot:XP_004346845.2 mannosidase [Capsaspora owczarzaki ATCC 30864]
MSTWQQQHQHQPPSSSSSPYRPAAAAATASSSSSSSALAPSFASAVAAPSGSSSLSSSSSSPSPLSSSSLVHTDPAAGVVGQQHQLQYQQHPSSAKSSASSYLPASQRIRADRFGIASPGYQAHQGSYASPSSPSISLAPSSSGVRISSASASTAVNFHFDPEDASGKGRRRAVGLFRFWNQMTRLQRSLILVLMLTSVVLLATFLPISETVAAQDPLFVDEGLVVNVGGNGTHLLDQAHQRFAVGQTREQLGKLQQDIARSEEERRRNGGGGGGGGAAAGNDRDPVPDAAELPERAGKLANQLEQANRAQRQKQLREQAEQVRLQKLQQPPQQRPQQQPAAEQKPVVGVANPASPNQGRTTEFTQRQRAVIDMFKWSWAGYKKCAWGKDELLPLSCSSHTWFDLGLTLVDALDTMYLMKLQDEFKEARDWVENHLRITEAGDVNLFETTIRILGSLLTTHHFTQDDMFKQKAIELGDILLLAFQTPSGIPYSDVNLKQRRAHGPVWSSDSSTAEVTTVQLEFRHLTHITGDPKYAGAVDNVMNVMERNMREDGLVPIYISPTSGTFSTNHITLGARGDSYYEYLLKQWLQGGKKEARLHKMYTRAMDGVMSKLVRKTPNEQLTYVGELDGGVSFSPKMDHLVCFLPGVLALGHVNGFPASHLEVAKELLYTCWQMYEKMPTGLAPEIAFFDGDQATKSDIRVKDGDAHNLMRPETVESLFILYRLTKDERYREWGWKIFQAFEKHSRVQNGYTSLNNVKVDPPPRRDKMESFWLGETIKYLFLLFSDDDTLIPLDKYVFNTEAHPLPIF